MFKKIMGQTIRANGLSLKITLLSRQQSLNYAIADPPLCTRVIAGHHKVVIHGQYFPVFLANLGERDRHDVIFY